MASAFNQHMIFDAPAADKEESRYGQPRNSQARKREKRSLLDFKMTRQELFEGLCSQGIICPRFEKVGTPPHPGGYGCDPTCTYHGGMSGHSIEICDAFKRHVLTLLDANLINTQGFCVWKGGWHEKGANQTPKTTNTKEQSIEEENQRLREENIELKREILRLKSEVTQMHAIKEREEIERGEEGRSYHLQLGLDQIHQITELQKKEIK